MRERDLALEVDLLRERVFEDNKKIKELESAVIQFADNLIKSNERVLRLTDIVVELSKPKPKPAANTGVSEVM